MTRAQSKFVGVTLVLRGADANVGEEGEETEHRQPDATPMPLLPRQDARASSSSSSSSFREDSSFVPSVRLVFRSAEQGAASSATQAAAPTDNEQQAVSAYKNSADKQIDDASFREQSRARLEKIKAGIKALLSKGIGFDSLFHAWGCKNTTTCTNQCYAAKVWLKAYEDFDFAKDKHSTQRSMATEVYAQIYYVYGCKPVLEGLIIDGRSEGTLLYKEFTRNANGSGFSIPLVHTRIGITSQELHHSKDCDNAACNFYKCGMGKAFHRTHTGHRQNCKLSHDSCIVCYLSKACYEPVLNPPPRAWGTKRVVRICMFSGVHPTNNVRLELPNGMRPVPENVVWSPPTKDGGGQCHAFEATLDLSGCSTAGCRFESLWIAGRRISTYAEILDPPLSIDKSCNGFSQSANRVALMIKSVFWTHQQLQALCEGILDGYKLALMRNMLLGLWGVMTAYDTGKQSDRFALDVAASNPEQWLIDHKFGGNKAKYLDTKRRCALDKHKRDIQSRRRNRVKMLLTRLHISHSRLTDEVLRGILSFIPASEGRYAGLCQVTTGCCYGFQHSGNCKVRNPQSLSSRLFDDFEDAGFPASVSSEDLRGFRVLFEGVEATERAIYASRQAASAAVASTAAAASAAVASAAATLASVSAAASAAAAASSTARDDDDVEMIVDEWTSMSLLCSFTQSRMTTPAKATACKHPPSWCFSSYRLAKFKRCPVFGCNVDNIAPDDIVPDDKLVGVLKTVPEDIDRIQYNATTGKWRECKAVEPQLSARAAGKRKQVDKAPSAEHEAINLEDVTSMWAQLGNSQSAPLYIDSDSD